MKDDAMLAAVLSVHIVEDDTGNNRIISSANFYDGLVLSTMAGEELEIRQLDKEHLGFFVAYLPSTGRSAAFSESDSGLARNGLLHIVDVVLRES